LKRLYPAQPLVSVGNVIICDGKILLEKRKNEPDKGKWSIPGGLVELGESLREAVIREVKEETSLTVEEPELFDVAENIVSNGKRKIKYHYVIVYYFVKRRGGKSKAASDASELRWIQLGEVEKYDLPKRLRDFFRRNKKRLEKLDSCH
jgi:8-oxo-dGTP diphosphatase